MSVYSKLQQARILLQNSPMKKSGLNKFAGYSYFELGDFLPQVNQIFFDLELCGVTQFTTDLATLTVVDTEDNSEIKFSSPMADAPLKGCLPIQNLGAVQTYQRRYLYVAALEIVEHDAVDRVTSPGKELKHTPNDGAGDSLTNDRKDYVTDLARELTDAWNIEKFQVMMRLYEEVKEQDEKLFLWTLLGSKVRAKIKKIGEDERVKNGL